MSNEQAKQEAIKKAYGKYYDELKTYINTDGWVTNDKLYGKYYKLFSDFDFYNPFGQQFWRPTELHDIENNNGWIRIEPGESNLPDDETFRYKVCKGEIIHNSTYNLRETLELHKIYELTHYKPIDSELKPIY